MRISDWSSDVCSSDLLLSYLLHNKGKVVSRTELIEHIYDQDFDRDSKTIEVFVTRIRKKLGADIPIEVFVIRIRTKLGADINNTIPGIGNKLAVQLATSQRLSTLLQIRQTP